MKKLKKLFIGLIVCTLLISQSLSSFAWVSVTGEGGWSDKMEGEYRIQIKRQGWLIYWIDDTQTVRSDVVLVGELGVINEFMTANYQCIKTRWQDKSYNRIFPIDSMDGMPKPYTQTLSGAKSNSAEMRTWIFNHDGKLVDWLNAPQEIKNCEEEDKYFFIAEPVYMFALFSPVKGVACEYIVGTTYQYSNYIIKNLLGTPKYPNTGKFYDESDLTSCGLTATGWWGTCAYTNGYYGTVECVSYAQIDHMRKIGIVKAGDDPHDNYLTKNYVKFPLNFSELGNKSIGLGIVIMSNSEQFDDPLYPPNNPNPVEEITTTPYVGEARPDTYTYHYAEDFNLDKTNNPQGRIPSGEMLTNGIDVDTWFCNYSLTKHSAPDDETKPSSLRRTVSVAYHINWTTINSTPYTATDLTESEKNAFMSRSDVHYPVEEKTHTKDPSIPNDEDKYKVVYYGEQKHIIPYTAYVTREAYYYTIDDYDVFAFRKAKITAENRSANRVSLYTGGEINYTADYRVSYNMQRTGGIIKYPQNKTDGIAIYADDFDDGVIKAKQRVSQDADNYVVRNDYLEVGGRVFVPSTEGNNGADYVKLSTYNFPNTGEGVNETPVIIPFTDPNDFYYTSGEYTYVSMRDSTKGVVITKNAPETHTEHTASINERIQPNYRNNEPVFVHTPVVSNIDTSGSGEVQLMPNKVNDLRADYQLRLDNTYEFAFDMEEHLKLLGYDLDKLGNIQPWDYSKYVKKAQVLFPFDVAIVTNPSGANVYTYYKAKTWIDVDYLTNTTYYIPTWAVETDYDEIYWRTIAYNIEEGLSEAEINALEQETHNLVPSNYVAYTKIAIQLSGYIYDMKVVGCNDSVQIEQADDFHDVDCAKQNKEFRAGTKNHFGSEQVRYTFGDLLTNNWLEKYTLPFSNGSSYTSNIAGTLGKGTKLSFTIKTIANCWNNNDELIIVPRLRYVSAGGQEYGYDDTQIYYFGGDEAFIKNGSDRDLALSNVGSTPVDLTSAMFSGTFKETELTRTLPIFNRINGTNYTQTYNIKTNNRKGVENVYHLGYIRIPNELKLYTGDEEDMSYNIAREGANVIRISDPNYHVNIGNSSYATVKSNTGAQVGQNTKELMYASMQTWYGQWTLPPKIYIAFTSDIASHGDVNGDGVIDLFDYAEWENQHSDGLTEDESIWIKNGYLVLNFDIYVRKNGVDHLTYYGNSGTYTLGAETVHGQNMMRTENARASFNAIVEVGGKAKVPVTLQTGDVAIFDMLHSTQDYFDVGVGWTN